MKYRSIARSSFRSLSLLLAAALGSHAFAQQVDTGEVRLIVKLKPTMRDADFKGRLNAAVPPSVGKFVESMPAWCVRQKPPPNC